LGVGMGGLILIIHFLVSPFKGCSNV
jgi:hypothetical protein